MSVSILAKCKEFADFWHRRLCKFYELSNAQKKYHEPLVGDTFFSVLKHEIGYAEFEHNMEVRALNDFIADVKKNAEYIPLDMKATYYELNLEIMQLWGVHIDKLKRLQRWTEKDDKSDRRAYLSLEHLLDSTFDYFICKFDELAGAIRVMQSCNGIKSVLEQEKQEEEQHFRNLNYQIRVRDEYKKGIERIYNYFNSEYGVSYDVGRIMNDVTAICNETKEKAENMPFDETEETGFIG